LIQSEVIEIRFKTDHRMAELPVVANLAAASERIV